MRVLKILAILLVVLTVLYLVGPSPEVPVYDKELPLIDVSLSELDDFIREEEEKHPVKKGSEARIVWADSIPTQTEFALVYLHGFSATEHEGYPLHERLAKRFGMNLYLARLADHGLDTVNSMAHFTVDRLWESAKFAYEMGRKLGKKVILVSTSTGGTLALPLAANYPDIAGIVALSPNIRVQNSAAFLMNGPWGYELLKAISGGEERIIPETLNDSILNQYWDGQYAINALVQLQELLETSMVEETFEAVKVPCFVGVYYKSELEQDQVVDVSAARVMYEQLGTPDSLKIFHEFDKAGNHVLASDLKSNDVEGVYKEVAKFIQNVITEDADI